MSKAKYEAVVIFSLKNGAEKVTALVEKFKALIEANGTLSSINEWGKRKLAYEIEDETEGYYVIYNFEAEPDFPAEFSRIVNITDDAVRTLIVRVENEAAAAAAEETPAEEAAEENAAPEAAEEATQEAAE